MNKRISLPLWLGTVLSYISASVASGASKRIGYKPKHHENNVRVSARLKYRALLHRRASDKQKTTTVPNPRISQRWFWVDECVSRILCRGGLHSQKEASPSRRVNACLSYRERSALPPDRVASFLSDASASYLSTHVGFVHERV